MVLLFGLLPWEIFSGLLQHIHLTLAINNAPSLDVFYRVARNLTEHQAKATKDVEKSLASPLDQFRLIKSLNKERARNDLHETNLFGKRCPLTRKELSEAGMTSRIWLFGFVTVIRRVGFGASDFGW